MGMFDRVILKCPKCNNNLEFQSKSGPCCLNLYSQNNITWDVAFGIKGLIVKCPKCSKNIKLEIFNIPKKPKIILKLTKKKADYSGETSVL